MGIGIKYVSCGIVLVSTVLPGDSAVPVTQWINLLSPRRQALPAIAVGHIIIACVMVLNGTIGARLHVSFPVLNRSSFGFWFSYFSVISRVALSMFWFGIQTYTGSECVYQVSPVINLPVKKPISVCRCWRRYGLHSHTSRTIYPPLLTLPHQASLSPIGPIHSLTNPRSGIMCYFLYWLIQVW